jgi:L-ascorbate metabolism protein UlaG (beta-lactamase superfamily)
MCCPCPSVRVRVGPCGPVKDKREWFDYEHDYEHEHEYEHEFGDEPGFVLYCPQTVSREALMQNFLMLALAAGALMTTAAGQAQPPSADTFPTPDGPLVLAFIGHGSLRISLGDKQIYIDPVSQYGDYRTMPKADLVLITHQHGDHLDTAAIDAVRKPGTVVIATALCTDKLPDATVLKNGDSGTYAGVPLKAVPAYNLLHKRPNGTPFHPKGDGNGYVLTLGGKRIYVAGDTENIPEMADLKDIDIAFLPMNLPYTMTPEMVAEAARSFKPKILYPYHYGDTDVNRLKTLMAGNKDTELKIRELQ